MPQQHHKQQQQQQDQSQRQGESTSSYSHRLCNIELVFVTAAVALMWLNMLNVIVWLIMQVLLLLACFYTFSLLETSRCRLSLLLLIEYKQVIDSIWLNPWAVPDITVTSSIFLCGLYKEEELRSALASKAQEGTKRDMFDFLLGWIFLASLFLHTPFRVCLFPVLHKWFHGLQKLKNAAPPGTFKFHEILSHVFL